MSYTRANRFAAEPCPTIDVAEEVRALSALLAYARQTALDIDLTDAANAIQLARTVLDREFSGGSGGRLTH